MCPVWCRENARQNALVYAQQRAGYGRCDIQVLNENWSVVETITNEDFKPVAPTITAARSRSLLKSAMNFVRVSMRCGGDTIAN